MRKSSSHSSRDSKPGGKSSFKKDDGRKPFNKDSKPFKKNYDGRGPSSEGSQGDKPYRSSKPYSGRVADGDGAARPSGDRKPFGKPSFGKDSKPGGFKPRKDFDKPSWEKKEGSDRGPRKEYDRPRSESGDRGPRKEYDRPRRDDGDKKPFGDRKPYSDRSGSDRGPRKEYDKPRSESGDRGPRKEYDRPRRDDGDKKPYADRKPFSDRGSSERGPKKEYDKPRGEDGDRGPRKEYKRREDGDKKPFSDRPKRAGADGDRKTFGDRPKRAGADGDRKPRREGDGPDKKKEDTRPFRQRPDPFRDGPERPKKGPDVISFSKDIDDDNVQEEKPFKAKRFSVPKRDDEDETEAPKPERTPVTKKGRKKHFHDHSHDEDEEDIEINQKEGPRLEMPLNKYIAHSGECSRRDAADMVKQGKVKVNEELVLDPGYRVQHDDRVTLSGKKLTPQKGMVYILLNKPKGFITTNEDPQGRKTVMELVASSGHERLFPVGRLDRDTSGLLLMTNDGELTQKLCHPSYDIKKVYHVTLDKPMTKADFEKVVAGVELEDGKAIVDEIAFLETKNELGLEIHSGRNRIVRRIFESLGYVVEKLDRVMYAGLTKKNLPRSKWRYLNDREIVLLKHFKN